MTLKSLFILLAGLSLSIASPALAATPTEIEDAVQTGVKFLYEQQKNANWDGVSDNPTPPDLMGTGKTALVVYALLSAGERTSNPQLAAAVEWLKAHDTQYTYALGLRAQVWNLLPHDREDMKAIIRKESALLMPRIKDPKLAKITPFRTLYTYNVNDDSGAYDTSCGQYAILGTWASEQAGADISFNYWKAVEDTWSKNQSDDGGWAYGRVNTGSSLNMTAAGIATMFITQEYLRLNDGIRCIGNTGNKVIDRGMAWMVGELPKQFQGQKIDLYGYYGIERIGVASGFKYFGSIDWYKFGADQLVRTQGPARWEFRDKTIGTSLAILFLTRGRFPVAINKLNYSLPSTAQTRPADPNWNQRPRDIANVTRFMGRQIERELNWQIVDFTAVGEDFHDAPILFLSGNLPLNLPTREEARLKAFVEDGGLILGHADCGNESFASSFRSLGNRLFPAAGDFRPLPDDHPIYTRQQFMRKTWKNKPTVLGLSNQVRELMLLLPAGDPGKVWQQNDPKANAETFQLMSDIFLYSVDRKNLRTKGATYIVGRDPQMMTAQTASIARLNVGPNPDPEPGGWRRLSNVMHNSFNMDVQTRLVALETSQLAPFRIAHLTGTGAITLTDEQRQALKTFVYGGGTLIVDAAGGDTKFAETVEEEMRQIFAGEADQLNKPLPDSHPLYSVRGNSITRVGFRQFSMGKIPDTQASPLLRGITIGKRLAVIYSREDLSAGLVGQPIDGIYGYTPDWSTALMRNAVLYAVGEPPKPPAPAAPPPPSPSGLTGGLLGDLTAPATQPAPQP